MAEVTPLRHVAAVAASDSREAPVPGEYLQLVRLALAVDGVVDRLFKARNGTLGRLLGLALLRKRRRPSRQRRREQCEEHIAIPKHANCRRRAPGGELGKPPSLQLNDHRGDTA